jgi:hypothetical protein
MSVYTTAGKEQKSIKVSQNKATGEREKQRTEYSESQANKKRNKCSYYLLRISAMQLES